MRRLAAFRSSRRPCDGPALDAASPGRQHQRRVDRGRGLGGIILARALGPTVRGEYAAITAWFGVALMIGGMGQPSPLLPRGPGSTRARQ